MKPFSWAIIISNLLIFSQFAFSEPIFVKNERKIDAKLAIAYASIMLVKEKGASVNEWLDIQAKEACSGEALLNNLEPVQATGNKNNHKSTINPSPNCKNSIYFCTKIDTHICADGVIVYSRSGDGVTVINATEGEFFKWEESVSCPGEIDS